MKTALLADHEGLRVITEAPRHLQRRLDPGSGLALIDPASRDGSIYDGR
jgi:hypothetical protein